VAPTQVITQPQQYVAPTPVITQPQQYVAPTQNIGQSQSLGPAVFTSSGPVGQGYVAPDSGLSNNFIGATVIEGGVVDGGFVDGGATYTAPVVPSGNGGASYSGDYGPPSDSSIIPDPNAGPAFDVRSLQQPQLSGAPVLGDIGVAGSYTDTLPSL